MPVIDEFVALLGYDLKGDADRKKFEEGLDRLDSKMKSFAAAATKYGLIAAAGIATALGLSIREAVKFEESMADVGKVLDMSAKDIKAFGRDILQLSKELPIAAEGIAQIVAIAGQSGVVDAALPDEEERAQLLKFAESASKMAVAFDISAGEAANSMVAMRNRMKLSQSEVLEMADAMNELGNKTGASSNAILKVVERVGSLGTGTQLATEEIAALAASFVEASKSPEVAATGFQNFLLALQSGEAATDDRIEIFEKLGTSATEMAERMQVDAKQAIFDILDSIAELEKAEQTSVLEKLFGRESIDAIQPLLVNLDGVRENFELIGNAQDYAGSMLKEYEARAKTTANTWELTKNNITALSVQIGDKLLPLVNRFLTMTMEVLEGLSRLSEVAIQWIQDFQSEFEGMDFYEVGVKLINTLGAGMKSVLSGLVGDVKSRLSGIFPDWMKWGDGEEDVAPSPSSQTMSDGEFSNRLDRLSALSNLSPSTSNKSVNVTSQITVNQTVTEATNAPGSAAKATGQAVGNAVGTAARVQAEGSR